MKALLPMSALGQEQTLGQLGGMSVLPLKADADKRDQQVRFVPKADKVHRSKQPAV